MCRRLIQNVAHLVLMTIAFAGANWIFQQAATANLVWENQYSDEDAIANGSMISTLPANVTFGTTVFSDSDGGTFDLAAVRSANFVSYEAGVTGNHRGYLEMTFDNQNNDPVDYVELSMNFSGPITNLQFSILDVDGSPSASWDDAVEIYFDGVNIKTDPSLFRYGNAVFLDNETYMDGFEAGNQSASSTQTSGNIEMNFGSNVISNITIRYFTTDDAVANPGSQFIGISDLTYQAAVPEVSTLASCLALGCFFCMFMRCRKPVVLRVGDSGTETRISAI